jgi:hypothetical protein
LNNENILAICFEILYSKYKNIPGQISCKHGLRSSEDAILNSVFWLNDVQVYESKSRDVTIPSAWKYKNNFN